MVPLVLTRSRMGLVVLGVTVFRGVGSLRGNEKEPPCWFWWLLFDTRFAREQGTPSVCSVFCYSYVAIWLSAVYFQYLGHCTSASAPKNMCRSFYPYLVSRMSMFFRVPNKGSTSGLPSEAEPSFWRTDSTPGFDKWGFLPKGTLDIDDL